MDYVNILAGQLEWAARNTAYNLDFIPEDKLNWKPAPTAHSALEVVQHMVGAFGSLGGLLKTGTAANTQPPQLTNITEAKQILIDAALECAGTIRAIKPEALQNMVETPYGPFTIARMAGMPVMDAIHHHGQIAYIQMMLGDTESHFDPSLFYGKNSHRTTQKDTEKDAPPRR